METTALSGKKILLVEDNSINQMLVRYTLSKTGAQIEIADNGSIALQKIKEREKTVPHPKSINTKSKPIPNAHKIIIA